ncbi:hypothetical protein [Streptantibioticus silvisoli]|uniref:Uncharacterized protein n=1 Tax=Streptantibioticus silvisoli TaxID=2705255 RepID=A0ABT6W5Z3_9ACTN|nr:hypothetical protein [Streptantibioticus silvisoli]MDI5965704.1 hypothetical protein [Streptantibioticus silvisoli]
MADYDFPDDLVQLRRDFHRTGIGLRALPADAPAEERQRLRDHERDLALQLSQHPWWNAEPGRGTAAKAVLQQQVADDAAAEDHAGA